MSYYVLGWYVCQCNLSVPMGIIRIVVKPWNGIWTYVNTTNSHTLNITCL